MSIKEYLNLIIGACEENNAEVISRIKAYAQRALKSVYIQDQILLNMDTLPEDEARFQAGYSRGHEVGYERGKGEQPGLPPLPEPILTDKDVRDWEGEKRQKGPVWVKASIPNIKDGEYISKYRKSPNDAWHIGVSVVDATHIHFIEKVSYNIKWQKGHEELHNLFILDESGTAAAVTPTFWDVAKAFKWAAEYRDEIGGQLTLYNDQWTLISEDEDGNENETKDLTPGSVAELYCLQNGFNKENEGTVAAREEDAGDPFDFYYWLIENHWEEHSSGKYWHRSKDRHQWPPEETCEKSELIAKFKQQKEKQ